MTTPHLPSLAVELYWSLPGPRAFLAELVGAIEHGDAAVVCVGRSHISGVTLALRHALTTASQDAERVEFIELEDGVHLESAVGQHFGKPTMSALEIAHHASTPRTVIAMTPKTVRARESCREYLAQFMAERKLAKGSARLLLVWNSGEDPLVPGDAHLIAFDGELSSDEIHAYVALRMIGRHWPGKTSLTRHLVTEFAGTDPVFAEVLMAMPDEGLLQLPASLASVDASLFAALRGVGRAGASAVRSNSGFADWQDSHSSGSSGEEATKRLAQRYWRACARSLLPWLEERRLPIIQRLRPALEVYLYPSGAWHKELPNGRRVSMTIEELEFNDIVAMTRHPHDPLAATDPATDRLLQACVAAKRARDPLAHMRPPFVADIKDAVRLIESALAS